MVEQTHRPDLRRQRDDLRQLASELAHDLRKVEAALDQVEHQLAHRNMSDGRETTGHDDGREPEMTRFTEEGMEPEELREVDEELNADREREGGGRSR